MRRSLVPVHFFSLDASPKEIDLSVKTHTVNKIKQETKAIINQHLGTLIARNYWLFHSIPVKSLKTTQF